MDTTEPQSADIPLLHMVPATVIGASVPWFRQRLGALGYRLNPSSALALELTALEEYRAASIRQDVVKYRDAADVVQHQLRVRGTDFITKAIHRAEAGGWTAWHARADQLFSGIPNLLAPSENSQARNLCWELVLAAVCAGFCDDVAFAEPDVTAKFNARQLGVAAKVLYSDKAGQQLEAIVDGAKQGARSGVDETYVICNITELIPHDKLFEQMHRARVHAPGAVKEVLDGWLAAFLSQHDERKWVKRLTGRDSLRAVILFAPTMVPTETLPSGFIYTAIAASQESYDRGFELAFHTACQSVLRYVSPERAL